MKRTLFILGQTDVEIASADSRITAPAGSKVRSDFSGVLPILPFVNGDSTLSAHSAAVLITEEFKHTSSKIEANAFNLVGDPDSSPLSLNRIQSFLDSRVPLRCFNEPANVLKTARGLLPTTLSDIPRCIVPRVEPIKGRSLEELAERCEHFGSWPIIVRATGYHGGTRMLLIQESSELEILEQEGWLADELVLIEFRDYVGEDGLYNKIRVIMIDGTPYPRHSIYAPHWKVHSHSRGLMDERPDLFQREQRFLVELRDKLLVDYAEVFQQIYRRIGLDVFGIDFTFVEENIVVFEANACMNFVDIRPDGGENVYLEPYIETIKDALKELLVNA